jgi:hypothetical protein
VIFDDHDDVRRWTRLFFRFSFRADVAPGHFLRQQRVPKMDIQDINP